MAILYMEGFDHWDVSTTSPGYPSGSNRNHPIKNVGNFQGVGISSSRITTEKSLSVGDSLGGIENRYYVPQNGSFGNEFTHFLLKQNSTSTVFVQYYHFLSSTNLLKGIGIPGQVQIWYSPAYSQYKIESFTQSSYVGAFSSIDGPTSTWLTGGLAYGVIDPNVWKFDSWNFIEVKFNIGSSGGVVFRINNQEVVNVSGITTKYTETYNATYVSYFEPGFYQQNNGISPIDNLVVYDDSGTFNNDWIGEAKVVSLLPVADGSYTDFEVQQDLEVVEIESFEPSFQGRTDLGPMTPTINGGAVNGYRNMWIIPIPWQTSYMGQNYGYGSIFLTSNGLLQFGTWAWNSIYQTNWTENQQPIIGNWFPSVPKIALCDRSVSGQFDEVYGGLCEDCEDEEGGNRTYRLWLGSSSYFNGIEREIELEVVFYESEPNRIDVLTKFRNISGITGVYSTDTKLGSLNLQPGVGETITTSSPVKQNYKMLNDIVFNRNINNNQYGQVSHVYSNTVNSIDSYIFSDVASYPGINVRAVQITFDARKEDIGDRRIAPVLVANGNTTIYTANSSYLGTTDQFYTTILETNPLTSSLWSPNDINNTEFGFKITE